MRRKLLISAFLVFAGVVASAQGIIVPEHVLDSLASPAVLTDSPLKFHFEKADIGDVREDASAVPVSFVFANAGKSPVSITKVTSSCGCVTVLYDSSPVAPGAEGKVNAFFHPAGRIGFQERTLYVYIGGSAVPAAKLSLLVNVLPGSMPSGFNVKIGPLACKRNEVVFNVSSSDERVVERIACVNTGTKALKLSVLPGFCPAWLKFRTDPAVIAPSGEGDIVLTLDRSALPDTEGSASVVLDGIDAKPSQRTLVLKYKVD